VSLTAADVAEIMRLLEQSSFNELTLEMEGIKLSLRRGSHAPAQPTPETAATAGIATPATTANTPPSLAPADSHPASALATPADPNIHEVASPLLGTFYRAPKPGAPPFVEVGSPVEAGTVVAIIEVMKLMNTVRAGIQGTVTEILLPDGALAEYAQPLLRVRKAG
jgi:acetyl-CoA carboxylase biotin carboxyl carrier protein